MRRISFMVRQIADWPAPTVKLTSEIGSVSS
jgi:hypothetical protein